MKIKPNQIWIYSNKANRVLYGDEFKVLGQKHKNNQGEIVWNIKWKQEELNNPHNNKSQEDTSWILRNCSIHKDVNINRPIDIIKNPLEQIL